ncbi:MAG TPA: PQQ-binding-like beta-propeller repeat protein, partial [Gemmataceae bacterium]|nr:PQQ-binding-like beta-propeller repeat protein [Gemmataceae bacterium]
MALRPLAACCLALSALAAPAAGQEWPRFRGPNGSGVSPTAVPTRWTERDFRWKVPLPGVGHSSPVLWGGRVFVTSAEEETGKRFLVCLRAEDGKQLWSRTFPGARSAKHPDNSYASATPAVDERHVYVCWGTPEELLVVALDHDGKEAWRRDLGGFHGGHGFGASPITWDGLVIVPNDQDGNSALFALDRNTGAVRWKVPRHSRATYTTPCVYQPEGRPAELIFANYEHGISALDPRTGRVDWEADVFNKGHVET